MEVGLGLDSDMSATVLKCPSCHRPLSCGAEVLAGRETVFVWCPWSVCRPAELGGPFNAPTIAGSYQLLDNAYREWLAAQPE